MSDTTQKNQDPEIDTPQNTETENPQVQSSGQNQDQSEEVKKLQEALLRSQADYQNLLMRGERDRADMVHFLSSKILAPLLTQIDNLERAVALKSGVEGDAFIDGVRSVFSGFQKYLESQNVKPFVSVGESVDPNRHDVMTEMPGEA